MRQVVLDTETTGLETAQGHRILEIGCVEIIDRKITGRHFHHYINPQRDIDDGALEVHGISRTFLEDKPVFKEIWADFLEFIRDSELIIHNAAFDIDFLDHEIQYMNSDPQSAGSSRLMAEYCTVVDTLLMARQKHPGQKNSLDALCKRYLVDNSQRDLHGALLDAEILADVYLALTGGQVDLGLEPAARKIHTSMLRDVAKQGGDRRLKVIRANEEELALHRQKLDEIDKQSKGGVIWNSVEQLEQTR